MKTIEFWYMIGSTYTYLAVERIEAIAQREGCELVWRPFSVRTLMKEQANSPFSGKPVKAAYMRRDVERRALRLGIPFTKFPNYPVDPDELATRVAFVGTRSWWCPAFTTAVYREWFLKNTPPHDPAMLHRVLSALGLEAAEVFREADSAECLERYAHQLDRARSLGIFGSPTLVAGDELFWGDGRIEDAMDWVTASQPQRV